MRHASCPPTSRARRPGRRAALTFIVVIAGVVLFGLLPGSAMAGTVHAPRGGMAGMPMADSIVPQTAPTPQVSMSPHAPTEVEAGPALRKVLEGLMCRCGCNLTVYACEGSMTCEVSANMRADAERMLRSGMSTDQVLSAFAADYGEQVLAAPTKKGFNLTAWVLPFAVLGIGALIVAFALRSWRPQAVTPGGEEAPPVDEKYLAEVEKELEEEE